VGMIVGFLGNSHAHASVEHGTRQIEFAKSDIRESDLPSHFTLFFLALSLRPIFAVDIKAYIVYFGD
jgi:hypothetical protein